MSVMTIPDALFRQEVADEIARLIKAGHDLISARQLAFEEVSRAFRSDAAEAQADHQHDVDLYTEEMSIGGRRYRERG